MTTTKDEVFPYGEIKCPECGVAHAGLCQRGVNLLTFTEEEARVLTEFIHKFRYSLWAFLREAPRSGPDQPYQRRMGDVEKKIFLKKLGLEER